MFIEHIVQTLCSQYCDLNGIAYVEYLGKKANAILNILNFII